MISPLLFGFIALLNVPETLCEDSAPPVSILNDFSKDLGIILELANTEYMPSNSEHKLFVNTLEKIQGLILELSKDPSNRDATEKFINDVRDSFREMLEPFVENRFGIADEPDGSRYGNVTVIITALKAISDFVFVDLPDSLKSQLTTLGNELREFGNGRANANEVLDALSSTVDAVEAYPGPDSDRLRYLLVMILKHFKPLLGESESTQEEFQGQLSRLVSQGTPGGLCGGLLPELLNTMEHFVQEMMDFFKSISISVDPGHVDLLGQNFTDPDYTHFPEK